MRDTTAEAEDVRLEALGKQLQSALGDGYAVEGRLGSGGFAVVYLVRDLNLKRKLAVKVLSPDLIASHSVLERFRREAETVAQLSHPNIVPLHFVGQQDDLVYLVMGCIDGGSLSERLKKEGQLPIEDAVRIVSEVGGALAHAHKRGVVHRDIKPENVLLDAESGRALVTDFGIARTAEGGSLTATGMVMGTPAYLSPEQVTGELSDHRADIYALGVMAYEMLAGRPPFTGATPTAILMKRLAGAPEPLTAIRPDVPQALADVVDGCLATDPNDRVASAADVIRALTGHAPASYGHTTVHYHPGRKTRSRRPAIPLVAGALLMAGVAVAAVVMQREGAEQLTPTLPPVDSGMVLIPSGTYVVGDDDGPETSSPAHMVDLQAFGIDIHEVTVGEYDAFVAAGRAAARRTTVVDPRVPVTGVVYAEAANYCAWKHVDGGRLPTEEEWEAAARGQAGRAFPWGATWDPTAANTGSRRNAPAPIGSHPAGRTPEGVNDLIGNVWEWTSSPYRAYGDTTTAAVPEFYVIRGGAFNSLDAVSTAVFRGFARPAASRDDLAATGFRCAMPERGAASAP